MSSKNDETSNNILGVFEGECADSNITNENGLDITREVWEKVFNSELYQEAIELGHLIGYLGHPEDPGCMDFKDACIVMTEGHIDDDGKVYGKFNLVDTPVGRIVKTFIDAGVTFGISVRGAGDIINNSVDPDTFVFRGFDLVTFPAYREAIPEFREIAASTDVEARKKYQKVCAAVKKNLKSVNSCEAIEIIQEQFPEQSDTYTELENRKSELAKEFDNSEKTIEEEKIDGLTDLYLAEKERADNAEAQLTEATHNYDKQVVAMSRKIHAMTRIVATQEKDVDKLYTQENAEITSLKNKNKITVTANKHLKKELQSEKENNLHYRTKIEASEAVVAAKDSAIRKLQDELNKTVIESNQAIKRASNLDDKVEDLKQQITASQKLVEEYQDAYASLYAQAVGCNLGNVSVTASTTVEQLRNAITGTSHVMTPENYVEPQQNEYGEVFIDDSDDNNLITT